jgi:hypothetical protein
MPGALPPWAVMWTLGVVIFASCKWITWHRTPAPAAPRWVRAAYLCAWPGLDARAFLTRRTDVPPTSQEWLAAVTKLVLGLVLLYAMARLVAGRHPWLAGWIGMIGMVMTLHFGSFHLLSCLWRRAGLDARPLMRAPLRAASLSDFWGRRWNTAFRDFTHRFLFRPLSDRWGPRTATAAGFLFSGLIHDLVISVPAGGGYGGPTVFFIVQGAAMLAERSTFGRRLGLGAGVRGWCYTMLVLAGPLGLLFHRPFVLTVILPFLDAIGAIR